MTTFARYKKSVVFLRTIDPDWADLAARVGPCRHDPKAARESYEALVRAIGYQQLTAKAGDAMIGRLKALHPAVVFPAPENILRTDFDALRACGFSAAKIATIKAIADGALSGLVPNRSDAIEMGDEELVERITHEDQGNRAMDRRNAAHAFPGAHGHSACRFRRAGRLPHIEGPARTSETEQAT
jgi:DNA-3-methyladenine glycosylase II